MQRTVDLGRESQGVDTSSKLRYSSITGCRKPTSGFERAENAMINRLIKVARRRLLPGKDHVVCSGSVIPTAHLRYCGPEFRDDEYYLRSAEAEARRLVADFGCDRQTKVLDIGCGQGRLPIGILRVIGDLDYVGIDVDGDSIGWCERHIERPHPSFRFVHLDVANERYNKRGNVITGDFRFDFPDKSFDIIYLFSVFSHMRQDNMRVYLSEFLRLLKAGGGVFFTTFVEEGVPPVSVNPDGYVFSKFSGPLHLVRYEKNHLFSVIDRAGFTVDRFSHGTEVDGQSAIYLSKTTAC